MEEPAYIEIKPRFRGYSQKSSRSVIEAVIRYRWNGKIRELLESGAEYEVFEQQDELIKYR